MNRLGEEFGQNLSHRVMECLHDFVILELMNSEKYLVIFLLLTSWAWANEKKIPRQEYEFQEDSKDEILVSKKYRSGLHLIYDCKDRFFVCVDEESFKKCQSERENDLKFGLDKVLVCAPFKKFPTRVDCLKAQYSQIQYPGNLTVCQRYERKKKN